MATSPTPGAAAAVGREGAGSPPAVASAAAAPEGRSPISITYERVYPTQPQRTNACAARASGFALGFFGTVIAAGIVLGALALTPHLQGMTKGITSHAVLITTVSSVTLATLAIVVAAVACKSHGRAHGAAHRGGFDVAAWADTADSDMPEET